MKKVQVITDGACLGNPGRGGWAAILVYGDHRKELFGCEAHTTNNRMELTAAIEGLRALREQCEIEVVTDSEYVKNGITQWIAKLRVTTSAGRGPRVTRRTQITTAQMNSPRSPPVNSALRKQLIQWGGL